MNDLEKLKALIRPVVIEVLAEFEKREAARKQGNRGTILLLHTGMSLPRTEFLAEVAQLSANGFRFTAMFSHSFRETCDVREVLQKYPAGTAEFVYSNEAAMLENAKTLSAILIPHISAGTAAKIVHGITDSAPSSLLSEALSRSKPVVIASQIEDLLNPLSEAAHSFRQIADRNFHTLQSFGAVFRRDAAGYLINSLIPAANETAERIARTKPAFRREFVTSEDVWDVILKGQKDLLCAPDAYITDEARELASARGITLRTRV